MYLAWDTLKNDAVPSNSNRSWFGIGVKSTFAIHEGLSSEEASEGASSPGFQIQESVAVVYTPRLCLNLKLQGIGFSPFSLKLLILTQLNT